MLQNVLKITNLYYSLHEDLTKRLQGCLEGRRWFVDSLCEELTEEDHIFPTTMNSAFMFNYPILSELAPFRTVFPRDLIPITIFGFMEIVPGITVHSTTFTLTLISRRSIYRNGRRFNTRGADSNGHVANYVKQNRFSKLLQVMFIHMLKFVVVSLWNGVKLRIWSTLRGFILAM